MRQHDKIINAAAKKILVPNGLFRQGTSRIWLDDNGYFMIIVVFESCNWYKGARLGVGISFLWEASEGLNDTLAYSYGGRVKESCEYTGDDDKFLLEMEQYADIAMRKVTEYRRFQDMDHAKKCLEQKMEDIPKGRHFWEVYDLAMLCFLMGEFESGKRIFDDFLEILKKSFYAGDVYIKWHEEFYEHCMHNIKPCLISKETAQEMVLDMIRRRRDFFCGKPSFKKMSKDDIKVILECMENFQCSLHVCEEKNL